MNGLKILLGIQILFTIIAIGAIIYFAVRRVRLRAKENFEKRDN